MSDYSWSLEGRTRDGGHNDRLRVADLTVDEQLLADVGRAFGHRLDDRLPDALDLRRHAEPGRDARPRRVVEASLESVALDRLDEDMRHMPEKYVAKDDYHRDISDIKNMLKNIFDKLDHKADK